MGDNVLCRQCNAFFDTDDNGPTSCSYHPELPVQIGSMGPRDDYADIWKFPCCGRTVIGKIVEGRDVRPPQTPGCIVTRHVRETG
jgi:hypothetical protein